ncbi:serine/threonine protein kinase [Gigaspora margarita]|uniref:Serine/threonine protein kinase n=1 Tax=Gigaspora margarita TaxID=4874 RepID=A0A8H3XEW1_GIGMA|nr:serine/threonine protein kinase [Gigaspora margarita]
MGLTAKSYCPECDQYLVTSHWCQSCQSQQFRENYDNWTIGYEEIDNFIKETQINAKDCTEYLEFVPFNSFIGINKYDTSGFGTVYTANWRKGPKDAWNELENKYVAGRGLIKVALISLGKDPVSFLKELKLQYNFRTKNGLIIRLFGVTRETVTGHLMMVAETCEWDLRHYVSHHFARLTWSRKVAILHSIACALESHQNGEQVHRDQSSNVQIFKSHIEIPVNELGLGESKDPIPIIVSEKIRLRKMKAKGLDTTPGKMVSPPKIHPQAIYTSRKIKFPIIPLSSINSQRIKQSYDASNRNAIDLASLLVRDESYFVKSKLLEKEIEEEIDDDLQNQYELSIPFDINIKSDIMVSS